MARRTLVDWADLLERTAAPTLRTLGIDLDADRSAVAGFVASFADEYGHRRAADTPFLAATLGLERPGDPAAPDAGGLDVRMWHAAGGAPMPACRPSGSLGDPGDVGIEAWTETELAALHGLLFIAARDRDRGRLLRCRAAATWHVAELQPDNATARPWAIHAFVDLACATDDGAAQVHAETMLSACQIALGHPDRLAAMILRDAGRTLRTLATWLTPDHRDGVGGVGGEREGEAERQRD